MRFQRFQNLSMIFDQGLDGKKRFLKLFKSVLDRLPKEVIRKIHGKRDLYFYLTKMPIYSPPPFTNYFIGKKTEGFPKSTRITGGGIVKVKKFKTTMVCFYSAYIDAADDDLVKYVIAHEIGHLYLKQCHEEETVDNQLLVWGFKTEWSAAVQRLICNTERTNL